MVKVILPLDYVPFTVRDECWTAEKLEEHVNRWERKQYDTVEIL